MKYNELNVIKNKSRTRVGRGIAAGKGKTAGRGTKGQNARSGVSRRANFEGGQNPLFKRIPKLRGFTRIGAKPTTLTTGKLNNFSGLVDNFSLYEANIIDNPSDVVRVVLRGSIKSKLDVHLQGASEGAIEMIVKAGGSFNKVPRVKSVSAKTEDK